MLFTGDEGAAYHHVYAVMLFTMLCCYYTVILFMLLCCLQVMRGEHTTRTRVLTAVLLLGGRSEGREIEVSGVCPCFIKKGNKK
jgi:hypothetical protein